jgi:2-dehydro-3-deoxygalactonokinase
MVKPMPAHLLGIDWGTSNRRAYLVDANGACLQRHADDQGLLAAGGAFAGSLDALRRDMRVDTALPIVMAGMVGSASGWQETPYLDLRIALEDLPRHLLAVRDSADCWIVPGYASGGPDVDVMRGEETQLLGVVGLGVRDGWVVLPGTHSKWVYLRDGHIERLTTFMTGELFALLGTQGTLGTLMKDGSTDDDAFVQGLEAARRQLPLTRSLFGVRAQVVTGRMPAMQARSYVSGLLIGTEFAAAGMGSGSQARAGALHLVASDALSASYALAARHFDQQPVALDPDQVFLAALAYFISERKS